MTHPTPEEIAKLFSQIISDPKRRDVLFQVLADPNRALDSLDLLIRSPSTSTESRKNYIGVRNALEAYLEEIRK